MKHSHILTTNMIKNVRKILFICLIFALVVLTACSKTTHPRAMNESIKKDGRNTEITSESEKEDMSIYEKKESYWSVINKYLQYLGKTPFEIAKTETYVDYIRINKDLQLIVQESDLGTIRYIFEDLPNGPVCSAILFDYLIQVHLNYDGTENAKFNPTKISEMFGDEYSLDQEPIFGKFCMTYEFDDYDVIFGFTEGNILLKGYEGVVLKKNGTTVDISKILPLNEDEQRTLSEDWLNSDRWDGIRTELGYLGKTASKIFKENSNEWTINFYKNHLNLLFYKHKTKEVYTNIFSDGFCRMVCIPTNQWLNTDKLKLTHIELNRLIKMPYLWDRDFFAKDYGLWSLYRNVELKTEGTLCDKTAYVVDFGKIRIVIMADKDGNVFLNDYSLLIEELPYINEFS